MTTYSDPVLKEYSRLANQYDRRWSFYLDATIEETLQRVDISKGQRILDLGCGTGGLIEKLLRTVSDVDIVGLDPSPEMIAIAREKLPDAVELKLGNADNLPLNNDCFDIVVSTSAFHYFRHPCQAILEAKRVLKPNGRLVITDWCNDYLTCRLLDVFLHLSNRAHFHTYRVAQLQTMLECEGFEEVAIARYKIDWFWGMMTAQAVKKSD